MRIEKQPDGTVTGLELITDPTKIEEFTRTGTVVDTHVGEAPAPEPMSIAERKKIARSMGWRGAKAKRRGGPLPTEEQCREMITRRDAFEAQREAVIENMRRQQLRQTGVIVPPTATEAEKLRAQGHQVGAGGLYVPGKAAG